MTKRATVPDWAIGPFSPPQRILGPRPDLRFDCPVSGDAVAWAAKDVFNAGAVVHEGRVCLLVRAEDTVGRYAGVSRIGLATSADGVTFDLESKPVLYPDDDRWQAWEWPGGLEDPRIVVGPDGTFVCAYTAFDGKVGCLFIATSRDLRQWTKHGPAFAGSPYARLATKAGAIVTELVEGRLVAARIDGRYWMYWGEGALYAATSEDLVRWTPVEADSAPDKYLTWDPEHRGPMGAWTLERPPGPRGVRLLAGPRRHRFDSLLVEPGPPAILTPEGVVLIYNGGNHVVDGDPDIEPFAYQPSQMLFDARDPTALIARAREPFLGIPRHEAEGQVGNVCFAQGLVTFQGQWRLYLGLADSRLGVSTAPF
uniref:Glycosidase PH1107-related n=1 Tax=Caulobacter sp. (strain K31) TaxID=366602 RepID=B0T907_CAUSK